MKLDLAHYQNRHSLKSKIARAVWNVVWLLLFRLTPERGRVFALWRVFLLRLFGAKIGRHCYVMASAQVWQPWNLSMGDWASLAEDTNCYAVAPISLGAQATVSQGAFLCAASHDIASPIMELTTNPITIGNQAWVCARAIILPGVTIGEGAVVGAGAVVTKDVEPWTVVAGNPARVIGKRVVRG